MSDEKKKPADSKYQADIVIGGEKRTINKLKAGKFYKAQTVFADIIKTITPKGAKVPTQAPVTPDEVAKVAEELEPDQIHALFAKMPKQIAEFVAICAEMEVKEFLDEAYPEEVPIAFDVCYKLNNIMENLKNYKAPLEKLGAGLK